MNYDSYLPDGTTLLYTKTKDYRLLDQGSLKLIGEVYHAKRMKKDGSIEIQKVVKFHYGNKNINDMFFFEDNRIVFHSISLHTEAFLTDRYDELLQGEIMSPARFIGEITELYTQKKMGY